MNQRWKDLAEPCREPLPVNESALGKVILIALVVAAICLLIAFPEYRP